MLRLMIVVCMMILGSNLSYGDTNNTTELEHRWINKNYRGYISVLNRFDMQGFKPFHQNSYAINSSLILETHQKFLKANVYYMAQVRVSFMMNNSALPIKDSFGLLAGLSGYLYDDISLLSGGKGISVLMYGGVYFSLGDIGLSGDYQVIGPEIGIRVNYSFHKNVALTFGLDIGYHHLTSVTYIKDDPSDYFPQQTFTGFHGFMIGASIGFTFNFNYI